MPEADPVALPLADQEVWRIVISRYVPYLRLEFLRDLVPGSPPGPPYYSLIIDGPFRLTLGANVEKIDPRDGPHLAYLGLVRKRVQRASAYRDGSLRVEFSDGETLSVAPYEFEPWQLEPVDGDGIRVVSVAGGGLATWDLQPPT